MKASDFPTLLTTRRAARLDSLLMLIEKAQNDRFLIKTEYAFITFTANNLLEEGFTIVVKDNLRYSFDARRYEYKGVDLSAVEEKFDLTYFHVSVALMLGKMKKIAAAKIESALCIDVLAYFEEVKPLVDAVLALKPLIGKKPPKIDPVLAYRAPPASDTASKAVHDLLVKITEDNFEKLVAYFRTDEEDIIVRFEKEQAAAQKEGTKVPSISDVTTTKISYGRSEINVEKLLLLEAVFDRNNTYENKVLARLPNASTTLDTRARQAADYQRRVFVYKNMKKMSPILDRKAGFDTAVLVRQSLDLIEAVIRVNFKDGSAFNAQTQIVWVYDAQHPFTRYPLTFHDVIFNGKRRAMLSEKQMNEVFATG